jgi:hypothetical protein
MLKSLLEIGVHFHNAKIGREKVKNILETENEKKGLLEVADCGQFHQHFTHGFFVRKFRAKLFCA